MTKRGRPHHPDVLTPREWEVLALIRDGLTNEQIAERIGVTIHAARYHVSQILSKLGVATREEAAAWQLERERAAGRSARALQIGVALAALGVLAVIGVIAWGVLRGSDSDAGAEPNPTASPAESANPSATPFPDTGLPSSNVRSMQLIEEGSGWALTDAGLFQLSLVPEECVNKQCKIEIAGPRNITPDGVFSGDIRGVHFFDPDHGWLVAQVPLNSQQAIQLVVYRTADRGETWQATNLGEPQLIYALTSNNPVHLDFVDAEHGWLVIDTQQTTNSPSGEIWRTADGGETWTKLASNLQSGDEVRFFDESEGWQIGGVVHDRLYVTHDGGGTWVDASDVRPLAEWQGTPAFSLPTSVNEGVLDPRPAHEGEMLILPITLAQGDLVPSLSILMFSTDGGATWLELASGEVFSNFGAGVRLATHVFEDGTVFIFAPGGTVHVFTYANGEFQTFLATDLPTTYEVQFADQIRGWAYVPLSECRRFKDDCYTASYVAQTDNGGKTWTPVTTPDIPTPAPTP